MTPQEPSNLRQRGAHEPFFDVDPQTGGSIEVFYSDRTLETFGRDGCGWFWWPGVAVRQTVRRLVRFPRAMRRIGTPWGPVWGLRSTPSQISKLNQVTRATYWRRGRVSHPSYRMLGVWWPSRRALGAASHLR